MQYAVIAVLIVIAVFIYKRSLRPKEKYPYHKKPLLTDREYRFYGMLRPLVRGTGLDILAKIRLADLLEVDEGIAEGEWGRYFGKIKAKHIDFAVAKDMKVLFLIELDDSTHQREDRAERDRFVDNALSAAGYELIRTYGELDDISRRLSELGYRTAFRKNRQI